MKIRILSDIHININHRLAPKYNKDNILTLIAGDISKNTRDTIRYINKNFNDTIFIEGNHLFYDHLIPINKKYEILHKKFPQSSNQTFLEQDYKVYQNHVIIGATLWNGLDTFDDHKYTEKEYNQLFIKTGLKNGTLIDENNQFKTLKLINKKKHIKKLGIEWFRKTFQASVEFIEKTAQQHADKKAIVLIHYPFSWFSLKPELRGHWSNPMFFSNLDKQFCAMKNVCLVIHGHTHQSHHYFINRKKPNVCIYANKLSPRKIAKLHKNSDQFLEVIANPMGHVRTVNKKLLKENDEFIKNLIIDV